MSETYKLRPERHDAIYIEEIAARYLPKSRPQEHPCAVITGGQPGCGKSRIAAQAITRFHDSGYVLVDADKMRPYHPEFRSLMMADDRTAANLTHPDCGPWATRLLRDGLVGRRNIIIDQTSRDPAAMARMTQELRQAGYRVELHVMAVASEVSELRIYQRYERQRAESGYGRFSTKDKHDEAYVGVAETVSSVEANKQVDRLCLYDHRAAVICDDQLEHGQWHNEPRVRQVMDRERNRPMATDEAQQFVQAYLELLQWLDRPERNATEAEKVAMRARYDWARHRADPHDI
ncbi:MAG: zeta toxin family protein [Alphaproteobacteria bacterium]|nr:zeta toxin family protein [Alphaproteobacteria bacterium]